MRKNEGSQVTYDRYNPNVWKSAAISVKLRFLTRHHNLHLQIFVCIANAENGTVSKNVRPQQGANVCFFM